MSGITVHLSRVSTNAKTGPMPVSTTSRETCWEGCAFYAAGCYANQGNLKLHWAKVTEGERGDDWESFCTDIAALPEGTLWRHNQAGDLPGIGHAIDPAMLADLVDANTGRRGFTYTHKPMGYGVNAAAVRVANANGFTINLSGNSPAHADKLAELGVGPVVTVLPLDYERRTARGQGWVESVEEYRARLATLPQATPAGRRIVVCPATYRDDVTCASCGLCAIASRRSVVGFPAHGAQRKKASATVEAFAA